MATNQMRLPKGFVLDQPIDANLPKGFVLDETSNLVKPKPKTVDIYRKYGMAEFGDPFEITGDESREASRFLFQAGGGMAGGAAGATVGHPIAGAGLGGMAGETLMQYGEHLFAPEAAPKSGWESAKKIGWAGGREMLEEGLARIAIKVGAPFAKKVAPKTKKIIEYLKRYKGKLTPAQATEDRALDLLENVAESSLLGGSRMFEFKRGQDVLLDTIADDIASRFGTEATKEQAGEVIQAIIKNKTETFRKVGSGLYKKVDDVTKGVLVSTKSLKKETTKMLKNMTTGELMPSLANKSTVKMLEDFQNLPDAVPFSYLNQWRSDLLRVGYAPSDLIPGKTAGTAKHLANRINNLFVQAEGGLSGNSLKALKEANTHWGIGKERFNSALIKRVVKKNPEGVLQTFIKRGNINDIREIKRMISSWPNNPWREVKGAYVKDLLFSQARDTTGVLSGKKLQGILNKMSPETISEIFGKAGAKELQLFAETALAVQQRAAGGGGMLIQLTQAGAILSLPAFVAGGKTGLGAGATGTVLLGPYAMSHLFTNPTGIKWLTEGLVTSAASKEAIRLAPRIIQLAGRKAINADKPIQAPSLRKLRGFGGRGF